MPEKTEALRFFRCEGCPTVGLESRISQETHGRKGSKRLFFDPFFRGVGEDHGNPHRFTARVVWPGLSAIHRERRLKEKRLLEVKKAVVISRCRLRTRSASGEAAAVP